MRAMWGGEMKCKIVNCGTINVLTGLNDSIDSSTSYVHVPCLVDFVHRVSVSCIAFSYMHPVFTTPSTYFLELSLPTASENVRGADRNT